MVALRYQVDFTFAELPRKTRSLRGRSFEAWLVGEDGNITEGTSSNAWILTPEKELITRAPTSNILNGITRLTIIEIAAQQGIKFVERPFSVAEAKAAEEAFTSSATSFVTPVVQIDDTVLSNEPGTLTINLLNSYRQYIEHLEATL